MPVITAQDITELMLEAIRQENTQFATIISVTGISATQTSPKVKNAGCEGLILSVVIANRASTGTILPQLQMVDDSANVITLTALTVTSTTNGTYTYWIHPHAGGASTPKNAFTDLAACSVPRNFQISFVYGGSGAVDLTAHLALVK